MDRLLQMLRGVEVNKDLEKKINRAVNKTYGDFFDGSVLSKEVFKLLEKHINHQVGSVIADTSLGLDQSKVEDHNKIICHVVKDIKHCAIEVCNQYAALKSPFSKEGLVDLCGESEQQMFFEAYKGVRKHFFDIKEELEDFTPPENVRGLEVIQ